MGLTLILKNEVETGFTKYERNIGKHGVSPLLKIDVDCLWLLLVEKPP